MKEIIIGITPNKISRERKLAFVDRCISLNLQVKDIPAPSEWLGGKFNASQIHEIRIEELLGRDPICLDHRTTHQGIQGKKILVTGAAGSIGSETVRLLSRLNPAMIILLDHAESPLNDLYHEIRQTSRNITFNPVIADVTDSHRMRKVFETFAPDMIFHASAYKHVPLMEEHPYEAVRGNVLGTKIMADLAVEFGVKKFVMISTDKAVNPTSVMGASKRICELYTQSLSNQPGMETKFITTRFGNVLGSNGSVIPLFRKQISLGGPVTITDRKIIRYFMTIPEACCLILEAGLMGNGGEIYLFDMGKPIRIYDLAEKMIHLSGFIPNVDIQIVEIGLRPGEKLYEELLANIDETLPTHNEKILIAKPRKYDFKATISLINDLVAHLHVENEEKLVIRMKDIIPEYKSQNSKFRLFDLEPVHQANNSASGSSVFSFL